MARTVADRHELQVAQQAVRSGRADVLTAAVLQDAAVFGPFASRLWRGPWQHALMVGGPTSDPQV